MQTDFLSPLNLTVEPFTIGAEGSFASPDATQLINPNRTAMLIDEIKISIGSGGVLPAEFITVLTRLHLGGTPLTNNFVPLYAFMPTYLFYDTAFTLTWHLARPLYVPPNVQFTVEFLRKLPFSSWSGSINTSQKWGFSVNGRSMPAGMAVPDKIYVPWVCSANVYSTTVPYVSGDSDIVNPFDEPLNVDYFAGYNVTEDFNVLKTPLTFQATLSNGKVFARDPIPFFALFPPDRPLLKTRALLQPKEFVSVVLDVPQPEASDDTDAVFTTVGMTGWRELQTPLGALP